MLSRTASGARRTDICHLLPLKLNESGERRAAREREGEGRKTRRTKGHSDHGAPACLQTEGGREGESDEEKLEMNGSPLLIPPSPLAPPSPVFHLRRPTSFRVLSYSVAATPAGGGVGGWNRKLREAGRMPQGLWRSLARAKGEKEKEGERENNLLYTLTWGSKYYKCEHNPHFNERDDAILGQYLQWS